MGMSSFWRRKALERVNAEILRRLQLCTEKPFPFALCPLYPPIWRGEDDWEVVAYTYAGDVRRYNLMKNVDGSDWAREEEILIDAAFELTPLPAGGE